MLFWRNERRRCVMVVLLVGALLSLVAFGSGAAEWLLFMPFVWFALVPPTSMAWRAFSGSEPVRELNPLSGAAASRAPPVC